MFEKFKEELKELKGKIEGLGDDGKVKAEELQNKAMELKDKASNFTEEEQQEIKEELDSLHTKVRDALDKQDQ